MDKLLTTHNIRHNNSPQRIGRKFHPEYNKFLSNSLTVIIEGGADPFKVKDYLDSLTGVDEDIPDPFQKQIKPFKDEQEALIHYKKSINSKESWIKYEIEQNLCKNYIKIPESDFAQFYDVFRNSYKSINTEIDFELLVNGESTYNKDCECSSSSSSSGSARPSALFENFVEALSILGEDILLNEEVFESSGFTSQKSNSSSSCKCECPPPFAFTDSKTRCDTRFDCEVQPISFRRSLNFKTDSMKIFELPELEKRLPANNFHREIRIQLEGTNEKIERDILDIRGKNASLKVFKDNWIFNNLEFNKLFQSKSFPANSTRINDFLSVDLNAGLLIAPGWSSFSIYAYAPGINSFSRTNYKNDQEKQHISNNLGNFILKTKSINTLDGFLNINHYFYPSNNIYYINPDGKPGNGTFLVFFELYLNISTRVTPTRLLGKSKFFGEDPSNVPESKILSISSLQYIPLLYSTLESQAAEVSWQSSKGSRIQCKNMVIFPFDFKSENPDAVFLQLETKKTQLKFFIDKTPFTIEYYGLGDAKLQFDAGRSSNLNEKTIKSNLGLCRGNATNAWDCTNFYFNVDITVKIPNIVFRTWDREKDFDPKKIFPPKK